MIHMIRQVNKFPLQYERRKYKATVRQNLRALEPTLCF